MVDPRFRSGEWKGWAWRPSLDQLVFASGDEGKPDCEEDLYGKKTTREWVLQRSECRRTAISAFLSEGRMTRVLLKGAMLCDVCRAQSKLPHPGKLVRFSAPTIPEGDIPRPRELPHVPPTTVSTKRTRFDLWSFTGERHYFDCISYQQIVILQVTQRQISDTRNGTRTTGSQQLQPSRSFNV